MSDVLTALIPPPAPPLVVFVHAPDPLDEHQRVVATPDTLGHVRLGAGLMTDADGHLMVDPATLPPGEIGPQGEKGDKGEPGNDGKEGPQGIQGIPGETGPRGIEGPQGREGLAGKMGAEGKIGPKGVKGDKGDRGEKGAKGDKGDRGDTGPQGIQGEPGRSRGGGGGGATRFLQLSDAPSSYAGAGGKTVAVKSDASGLEFVSGSGGTPTAHASSHASAGSDPLTLAQSQITNLVSDLAGKVPTSRSLTINGVAHDLSADRSWTVGSPFVAANDSAVPLIARGFSPTQTGNLEEWQASDASILASISSAGWFTSPRIAVAEGDNSVNFFDFLQFENLIAALHKWTSVLTDSRPGLFVGIRADVEMDDTGSSANAGGLLAGFVGSSWLHPTSTKRVSSVEGLDFIVYNEAPAQTDTTFGTSVAVHAGGSGQCDLIAGISTYVNNYGSVIQPYGTCLRISSDMNNGEGGFTELYGIDVGTPDLTNVADYYAMRTRYGRVLHKAGAAGVVPLSLQCAASPTADMLRLLDSDGSTILHRYNKDGYWITSRHSAPADGDLGTGDLALWFDQTAGAAKLKIKAKNASGTVVSGEIALA